MQRHKTAPRDYKSKQNGHSSLRLHPNRRELNRAPDEGRPGQPRQRLATQIPRTRTSVSSSLPPVCASADKGGNQVPPLGWRHSEIRKRHAPTQPRPHVTRVHATPLSRAWLSDSPPHSQSGACFAPCWVSRQKPFCTDARVCKHFRTLARSVGPTACVIRVAFLPLERLCLHHRTVSLHPEPRRCMTTRNRSKVTYRLTRLDPHTSFPTTRSKSPAARQVYQTCMSCGCHL